MKKKPVQVYHFSVEYIIASNSYRQARSPYWALSDKEMNEDWIDVTQIKKGTNEEFWKNYRTYIHYTGVDIVKSAEPFENKHFVQIASDLYKRID